MSINHGDTIIEVDDLSFRYAAHPVLSRVSFVVHRGDYIGIIGPNGGGKTTLLKLMLNLLAPESGRVRYFGTDARAFREWGKIGYVSQKVSAFDPQFPATVAEVVAMGRTGRIGIFHRFTAEDHAIIDRALRQVGMNAHRHRRIGELSGGQQQRVFIARALAGEPEILFLDEPTVGVDVAAQEDFYLLLKTLNQELGLTLILVSHDIDVVASQATELACINNTLIYHGTPHAFDANEHMRRLYGKEIKYIVHDH
jgi:zinc transport system ATP-binding protein